MDAFKISLAAYVSCALWISAHTKHRSLTLNFDPIDDGNDGGICASKQTQ